MAMSVNVLLRRRRPLPISRSRLGREALDHTHRDWANLGDRVTGLIGEKVLANDVADYLRFRAVCGSWRGSTDEPREHSVLDPRFQPRRWILLPEQGGAAVGQSRRRMLNLTTGKHITVDLPDLAGDVLVAPGPGGSPGGVLILINERDLVVRLLNPLTGQVMDFPSVAPVLSRGPTGRLDKEFFLLCKVTGAGFAGESTVVLHFGHDDRLVSAKLGDSRWRIVREGSILSSVFPFYGKVYFANWKGLMVVDAGRTRPRLLRAAAWPTQDEITFVHMADNAGELVVVTNMVNFDEKDKTDYTVDFEVFRLDAAARTLVPVTDLGGKRALFAGDYGGAVAASSDDGIIPNTIYYQHDKYNKFYVHHIGDEESSHRQLPVQAAPGSFIDELTSYVKWNGHKTRVALAATNLHDSMQLALVPR